MAYFSQIQPRDSDYAFPELTDRGREILSLMARHLTNKETALQLHLSPKTVRNYASNVINKLRVADCAEATILAQKAGLAE